MKCDFIIDIYIYILTRTHKHAHTNTHIISTPSSTQLHLLTHKNIHMCGCLNGQTYRDP